MTFFIGFRSKAVPTPGFALPPYHVESFPIGSCVCNASGFNCLSFPEFPGVKFTTLDEANLIAAEWNAESRHEA